VHAKWVAEERAAQVERDAAAAARKRPPGRPRLTSGIRRSIRFVWWLLEVT
jgi:hypothetical protein